MDQTLGSPFMTAFSSWGAKVTVEASSLPRMSTDRSIIAMGGEHTFPNLPDIKGERMAYGVVTKVDREQRNLESNLEGSQNNRPQSFLSGPYTITTALIAINLLVFAAMVISGVSFTEPTPLDALKWGADFGPVTVGEGQWWRLLTACFVHFGIIHIAFNMYVLYQIGPFVQITFGRTRYLIIYFAAGLSGSVISLWIHPQSVGAGASGAIFGLYGAVFGFLLRERRSLNPAVMKSIAKSAGIFILYNLVFGVMNRTTDVSAHLGGLLAGFLAGIALVRDRKSPIVT
jgi:rhomboid protease GluP